MLMVVAKLALHETADFLSADKIFLELQTSFIQDAVWFILCGTKFPNAGCDASKSYDKVNFTLYTEYLGLLSKTFCLFYDVIECNLLTN